MFSLGRSIAKCEDFVPELRSTSLRTSEEDPTSSFPKSRRIGVAVIRAEDRVLWENKIRADTDLIRVICRPLRIYRKQQKSVSVHFAFFLSISPYRVNSTEIYHVLLIELLFIQR